MITTSFWTGRRVLVTGHTGFKGGWLAVTLAELGADVTGLGLAPESADGVFEAAGVARVLDSRIVDLLDGPGLQTAVRDADPDVVFHLAAQALVLPSVEDPVGTLATNVVGTAALLAACRHEASPSVVLVATSDKVYANDGSGRPFTEGDRLGGGDPYSASKAAAELVVESWRHTYGGEGAPVLATARAGNVIGGGDVAAGRLLPDLLRAFDAGRPVQLRNPRSRRPWQFVLDPVTGYIAYAEHLHGSDPAGRVTSLNFGPAAGEAHTVAEVADRTIRAWGSGAWESIEAEHDVEAPMLSLDATLATDLLGWRPTIGIDDAVQMTVDWHRGRARREDMAELCRTQIRDYRARAGW